jgi:hypothetical protein
MRTTLLAAAAAAALLTAGTATAQNSGQTDVPSARHQNSAHANAPGAPDQMNSGDPRDQDRDNGSSMQDQGGPNGMPDQGNMGGMRNTSMGNDRDRDNVRVNTGPGGDRLRVNENGNHLRLTTTQLTRVRDVIVRAHGPRLTHVTFRVGVGARIPRTVRVAVLPPEIVAIAPEWQGYSYFEYGDQIVIVDPVSFAIVATLAL